MADRERASYTSQVVRYRSGRSSLPPPPEPPAGSGGATAEAIVGPAEPASAAVAEEEEASSYEGFEARELDDGSLDQFMREMMRETEPAPATPEADPQPQAAVQPDARASSGPVAARLVERERLPGGERLLAGFGLRPRPEAAPVPFVARPAEPEAAPERTAGPPRVAPAVERGGPLIVSDQVTLAAASEVPDRASVHYALAEARAESATTIPGAPPAVTPVIRPVGATPVSGNLLRIPFAAGATAIPTYARPMLRHAAAVAREDGGLVVVARSQAPEVAEERARAVGEVLLALGVEAATLRLLADGDSGREEVGIDPLHR